MMSLFLTYKYLSDTIEFLQHKKKKKNKYKKKKKKEKKQQAHALFFCSSEPI